MNDGILLLYRGGKLYRLTPSPLEDGEIERAVVRALNGDIAAPPPPPSKPQEPSTPRPAGKSIDCPLCWRRNVPTEPLGRGRLRCGHCGGVFKAGQRLSMRAFKQKQPAEAAALKQTLIQFGSLRDRFRVSRRTTIALGAIAAAVALWIVTPANLFSRGQQPLYPAHGEATFDGRPMANASIVLHPRNASKDAPQPRGSVDAEGRFVLGVSPLAQGAPAGEYDVTVQWYPPPSGKDDDPPPRNLLPNRYAHPESSGLSVRIEAGENQLPPIRLKKP